MSDLTIVTSFFDIGRKNSLVKGMARSSNDYLSYFRVWARMKNNLIVYTQSDLKDSVLKIRDEFGLLDKTRVVVIDDIYSIMPEYFEKMREIENNPAFSEFRFYNKAMSNQAKYCYLVLLQYWFIQDAVSNGWINDFVAWIDFGFNHGNKYYTNEEEFAYCWNYEFERKINCFALFNPKQISSIDSLQFQKDCIMGGVIVLPKEKADSLWKYVIEAERALFMLDCMDDDQQLLLMAYKMNEDDFVIRICDWFQPLKICGGDHLTVKAGTTFVRRDFVWRVKKSIDNCLKFMRSFVKESPEKEFLKRSKKRYTNIYEK